MIQKMEEIAVKTIKADKPANKMDILYLNLFLKDKYCCYCN